MAVNGKQKGSRAERELCKLFTTWWGGDEPWERTPASGAYATRGKKIGRKDAATLEADLVAPHGCTLSVESKKREGWNIAQLFQPMDKKKPVAQWWDQTVRQASDGKVPMLVFGKNLQPWMAMLPVTRDIRERVRARDIGLPVRVELRDGSFSDAIVITLGQFFQEFHPNQFLDVLALTRKVADE